MIRVSGLKEQIDEGVGELSPDGMTPSEQLTRDRQSGCGRCSSSRSLTLKTCSAGAWQMKRITIEPYNSLNAKEKKLDKYFRNNLFPILTPQSVDSSHPFPYISNLSLNLGLFIEPNRTRHANESQASFPAESALRASSCRRRVPRLIPIRRKERTLRPARRGHRRQRARAFPEHEDERGIPFPRDARCRYRASRGRGRRSAANARARTAAAPRSAFRSGSRSSARCPTRW